jgi:hypothetical protein
MNKITTFFKSGLPEGVGEGNDVENANSYVEKSEYGNTETVRIRSTNAWGVRTQEEIMFKPIICLQQKEMVYVEAEELDAIAKDISILSEIAKDMSELLEVQETKMSVVEANIDKTDINVKKACEQVGEVLESMKSAKYKRCGITTVGCAVAGAGIGMAGGPPGVAIGAGVGAAIGIVGSTISSML